MVPEATEPEAGELPDGPELTEDGVLRAIPVDPFSDITELNEAPDLAEAREMELVPLESGPEVERALPVDDAEGGGDVPIGDEEP